VNRLAAADSSQTIKTKQKDIQEVSVFSSRADLIGHMAKNNYYKFLKRHLPYSKVFQADWKIFYPIIWYGLTFGIRKYLEFSVSDKSGGAAAALANKCINIFVVFQFKNEFLQKNQLQPLDIFTFLNAVNFQEGRCKFIEGDIDTALDRIDTCSKTKIYFDFALFQLDNHIKDVNGQLGKIIDHITTNGALIILSNSSDSFKACWEDSKKKNPMYTFVHCFEDEVGLILKFKIENENGVEINEMREMKILHKAWLPIKKQMFIYYFIYFLGLFIECLKKCFYEPFWRWPMPIFNHCKIWINNRTIF
jgi:hypothetical protein